MPITELTEELWGTNPAYLDACIQQLTEDLRLNDHDTFSLHELDFARNAARKLIEQSNKHPRLQDCIQKVAIGLDCDLEEAQKTWELCIRTPACLDACITQLADRMILFISAEHSAEFTADVVHDARKTWARDLQTAKAAKEKANAAKAKARVAKAAKAAKAKGIKDPRTLRRLLRGALACSNH